MPARITERTGRCNGPARFRPCSGLGAAQPPDRPLVCDIEIAFVDGDSRRQAEIARKNGDRFGPPVAILVVKPRNAPRIGFGDEDGPIAECERSEDARFILAVRDLVAGREGDNDYGVVVQAEPPSPSVWCRDEVADGTEAQRQLRDGKEHPIIKLHVTHPRSVYNEDFILVSRNDVGDLSAPMN